jgi:hypothetical protein
MTTQAHPPSEAQQLHDARIANDQLRVRLAEQEALVAQERARADGAEREAEYWRNENRSIRDAAARTMEDAICLMAPAVALENERNDLRAALAALVLAVERAGSHLPADLPGAMHAARAVLTKERP